MPRSSAQFPHGAADTARRFGVTIKALRLYEDLGLLGPSRTGKGWRTYGREENERLHVILSLRQFGLPLARIAELLKSGGHDLRTVIELQETALLAQQQQTERALDLVRATRARMDSGETPTVDEMAALVRRTAESRLRWTPRLEALAAAVFTNDQRQRLAWPMPASAAAATSAAWAEIFADVDAVMETGDPAGETALALARRAAARIDQATGGDHATWAAMFAFWQDALADPATAGKLPMSRRQWDFLSRAIAILYERGELPTEKPCSG